MSASRSRLTLNAHFAFGDTESFNLWVSSSPTQASRTAFASALALDPAAAETATLAAPLPVPSLKLASVATQLETEPRLKLETLADMIKRAKLRDGVVSLSAYRE